MLPTVIFASALAVTVIAFFIIAAVNAKRRSGTGSSAGSVTPKEDKLLKAAEKGDAEAQFKLAKTYEFKESGKYIYWLEKASEQGYDAAILELANEYDYGNRAAVPPIRKNRNKAVEYFMRLADKGDVEAMKRISLIYSVEFSDDDKAREWTEKAANAGDTESIVELGDEYRCNSKVADKAKAEYWYRKAADSGSGKAMKGLGDLYNYDEKEPDFFKAESWYKKAVSAGEFYAYVRLGDMCRDGKGCAKDEAAAFEYYKKAADKGEIFGKLRMAEAYQNGGGVERNEKKAVEILNEAAQTSTLGKYPLGLCYFNGTGVEQDYNRAVQIFKECPHFDRNATYKLGECYYFGYGVKEDKEQAKKYWLKSAKFNNEDAKECLKIYFGETADEGN